MPVIPNVVERFYMLRLNRSPGPMLDLFNGVALEAAMIGQELGVFEALEARPADSARLAERVGASEDGLDVLLAFLAQAGYVAEDGGSYRPTEMARQWFVESSATSYARYFRFWRDVLYPFWREHGETAIREGEPPQTVYDWLDDRPELWPVAQAAFELTAELLGEEIAAAVDLPEDARLLDVGGGHALYSVAFAERHPSLRATVFDDTAMRKIARDNVAAAGLEERIQFRSGDYETDALGEGYDGALVFNVLHGNDPDANRELLAKVADATTRDATLAILDQFGDESRLPIVETGTRFLDLTYLVSLGGRTYETATVREWLAPTAFELAERREFRDRNMTLLVAEKSG